MLPEPPVPIAASWNGGTPTRVTFSTFLEPGPLDPTNWFIYEGFLRWNVIAAQVLPAYPNPIVELTRGFSAPFLALDFVQYAPPPFDVISRIGSLPAPPFDAFPLGP